MKSAAALMVPAPTTAPLATPAHFDCDALFERNRFVRKVCFVRTEEQGAFPIATKAVRRNRGR
jgi:hypothetical protein